MLKYDFRDIENKKEAASILFVSSFIVFHSGTRTFFERIIQIMPSHFLCRRVGHECTSMICPGIVLFYLI